MFPTRLTSDVSGGDSVVVWEASLGSWGHLIKALRAGEKHVNWYSPLPFPASHPRLRKAPGDVCVSGSREQSSPPRCGHEGPEPGGADSRAGGDSDVPGVVTLRWAEPSGNSDALSSRRPIFGSSEGGASPAAALGSRGDVRIPRRLGLASGTVHGGRVGRAMNGSRWHPVIFEN